MRLSVLSALPAAIALAFALPASALDMPETKVTMETCMSAALTKVDGKVSSMKLEIEDGKPLYEFEIKTSNRQTWELECDAMTGEIVETSRTADRNDKEFKAAAKVLEKDARKMALEKYPGKVTSSELEIAEGRAVYEVEIDAADGRKLEVEVDAATGEIGKTEVESEERTIYEIGG